MGSIKEVLIQYDIRSERKIKKTSCGKTGFDSENATRHAIKNLLRKGANVPRMRAYFCDECKHWHMTSLPRDRRDRKPRYRRNKRNHKTDE